MTGADRKEVLIFDIPEGYGRFWMRFGRRKATLIFGICGRRIKVGKNMDAEKDKNRSAPVFGIVCQSAEKARAIAEAFNELADEMEKRN
jgi:hypothetical protein